MLGIDWKNGQAGGTPLSAENLKLMQSLIETEITTQVQNLNLSINEGRATSLFKNNAGVNPANNITLNDDVEDYECIEILYGKNAGAGLSTVRIYPQISKNASAMNYVRVSSSVVQILLIELKVETNILSQVQSQIANIYDNDANDVLDASEMRVFQVLGYKKVSID